MKTVARMELSPGMETAEDVFSYQGKLLIPAGTTLDNKLIAKLARYSVMCVCVKEKVDYAATHYERICLSDGFRQFEQVYRDCLQNFKTIMTAFVQKRIPFSLEELLEIRHKAAACAVSGERLLDYLYYLLPSEDDLTHAHCFNSALIAGVFGPWLGLGEEDTSLLIQCGFFYDIGKLKLPAQLIWKPEKLTDFEFNQVKTHPILGFQLLGDEGLNPHVLKAVLNHHERFDGSGYPSHLRGEQIDIFAKYTAVIDAYEAMTSARTYRQSLNPFQVIESFEKEYGGKYDKKLLKPVLAHLADNQLGLKVGLNDDTEAIIAETNPACLSRPRVQCGGDIIDLNLRRDLRILTIL